MKTLLQIQALDLRIENCKQRETEIPKQKDKFNAHKNLLAAELKEAEDRCTAIELSQREAESANEQRQAQIIKYETQLMGVKKNEEYQALLHEIESLKKQIAQNDEKILQWMEDLEEAQARLNEDKQRIATEQKRIDEQCAEIDSELEEAVAARKVLEVEREPLTADADQELMQQYNRIRRRLSAGRAIVPLSGESCGGCHMFVRPQIVNEVLAGKVHACQHCSRLMYDKQTYEASSADTSAV